MMQFKILTTDSSPILLKNTLYKLIGALIKTCYENHLLYKFTKLSNYAYYYCCDSDWGSTRQNSLLKFTMLTLHSLPHLDQAGL